MKTRNSLSGLLAVLILAILPCFSSGQTISCRISFDGNTPMINGRTNASMVKPGDTICLNGSWQFMKLSYLHGTREAPIVVINQGGMVLISGFYYGMKIDSCSHLKLSGAGSSSLEYGIKVYNVNGFGISIENLSTDIEMDHVEISNTVSAGVYAKTDPDTTFVSTRDKYTMRNTVIHDCYFHNIGMEGFYVGNSFYDGVILNYHGKDTLVYPHLLRGVKIYNNRVENTGWDGIQVACADSGCSVYDNYVFHDSDSTFWQQMTGILFGNGSNCDCFNNIIKDGKGDGIDIFGLGGQKIYNNLIINAGRRFSPDSSGYIFTKHGIYRGQKETHSGTTDYIAYNTIVSPRNFGVTYSNFLTKGNLVGNNIITDPGAYPDYGQMAFVRLMDPQMELIDDNNLKLLNTAEAGFINVNLDNYDLIKTSPAVNTAKDIPALPLVTDIEYRSRPFSVRNDIGAYECHDSSLLSIHDEQVIRQGFSIISIITRRQEAEIQYRIDTPVNLSISLINAAGLVITDTAQSPGVPGIYSIRLGERRLRPGLYVCIFKTNEWSVSKKFIID